MRQNVQRRLRMSLMIFSDHKSQASTDKPDHEGNSQGIDIWRPK